MEILYWNEEFNERYVDIVEIRLHEALSSYKRATDGSFGRSSGNKLVKTLLRPNGYTILPYSWL